MKTSLNLLVVDGKKVINTASVSATAKGQPVHIKAVDGAKYLLSSGDNQAAPEHMLVKRVGKDLQIFSEDGDTTPAAIVDGFYDHQGELSGLAADGTYHTYINQDGSDRDAFLLLDDNGTSTLILGDATSGLDGLSLASGLSTTAIAVGALAALAALAGVVAAASGHHGGDHHSDPTPSTPTGGMAMDHVGSVQGKILAGGVTDDPRPQLSGVATANSLVRIYDNGQPIGSARAAADGSWTFKPEKALAEGSHSLTYSATLDGHESAQSAPIGFTVDTTPPDAPATAHVTDGNGQDLSTGGLTNNGKLNMSGRGVAGDVVKIWDGATLIGSGVVGADGSWNVPVVVVGDGEHDLSASFTDPAGNESAKSAPVAVELDTTAPSAPAVGELTDGNGLDLSAGGLTSNGDLNMSGRGAVPGDVVKIWDGATLIGSGVVGADGSWNVPVVVGEGEHDLSASFTDPAGNQSARSAPLPVNLDTTAPDAPVGANLIDGNGKSLSGGDGLTNNGDLVMSGSGAAPGDVVKIWDGESLIGSSIVGPDGSWSVPVVVVGDGDHNLSASFTDPAGNESAKSAPIAVDLDTTAPGAPAAGSLTDGNAQDLSAGGLTNSPEMNMSGSGGTAGDTVTLYDGDTLIGSATVGADGSWTIPAELAGDRTHDLSTSYTDPAGNESARSAPVTVNLDTTAPDAPAAASLTDGNGLDLSAGGLTNSNEMNMSGSGGSAGDTVNLYDGDTLIGSATVGADGSWTIPAELAGDRAHDLSTSYTDPAGNESVRSAPITVDLDTTAPDAPAAGSLTDGNGLDLSAGGLTNSNEMNMSGSGGSAGDTVNLYDGDTLIGSATVGADGSWSIPAEISGDRIHNLSTSYTDRAGNEGAKSTPIAVDLDTTAPDAPAAASLTDGNGLDLSAGGLTNSNEMNMSGSGGSAGDTVNLYDGDTLIGSATVGADGSWTIPAELAGDRAHDLSTSYTDPAGNESARSAPVTVNLDTTAPDAPAAASLTDGNAQDLSAGGLTNSPEMNMSGSGGTAGDTVNLYDGDTLIGSAIVEADGSWTLPATISGDTAHSLTTSYTDPAGNESVRSAPIAVELDTAAPLNAIIDAVTDNTGTVTNPLHSGSWTDEKQPQLSGTASEGGLRVELRDQDGNVLGTAITDPDGSWRVSPDMPLANAEWSLTVRLIDAAGNSSDSDAFSLHVDDTVPAAPTIGNLVDNVGLETGTLSSGSITDDTSPTLNGSGPANGQIVIMNNGVPIATVDVSASGSWSWSPSGDLPYDNYTLTAQPISQAGVIGPVSREFDFTLAETVTETFNSFASDQVIDSGTAMNGFTLNYTGNATVFITPRTATGTNAMQMGANRVNGTYSFVLNDPAYNFSFQLLGIQLAGSVKVNLYDADNHLIGTHDLPATVGVMDFSFDAPAGTLLTRVDIVAVDETYGFAFDNIHYAKANAADIAALHGSGISSFSEESASGDGEHSIMAVQSIPDSEQHTNTVQHHEEQSSANGHPLNTLIIDEASSLINLSHIVHQLSEVDVIDITAKGDTTLNVSINDVLALGSEDLFLQDGNKQLLIKGDAGDVVNLESINGEHSPEQWNAQGQVTHDGTTYNVYQNVDHEVEVLIQQGVQTHLQ